MCIFGCLLNPILVGVSDLAGQYEPIEYTLGLSLALGCVALFYVLAQVYVSHLYYTLKASWARVTLNLQIIVTFFFDTLIADVTFSSVELAGCAVLLLANAYLFLSDFYLTSQEKKSTNQEPGANDNQSTAETQGREEEAK